MRMAIAKGITSLVGPRQCNRSVRQSSRLLSPRTDAGILIIRALPPPVPVNSLWTWTDNGLSRCELGSPAISWTCPKMIHMIVSVEFTSLGSLWILIIEATRVRTVAVILSGVALWPWYTAKRDFWIPTWRVQSNRTFKFDRSAGSKPKLCSTRQSLSHTRRRT